MHPHDVPTPDRAPRPAQRRSHAHAPGSDLRARLALDAATMTDAQRLRHESYASGGYIEERPNRRFGDPYDDRLNCTTIVVYKQDRAVASVRTCLLEPGGALEADRIPVCEVFEDVVGAVMQGGDGGPKLRRAIEINRLVRHPDFATDGLLVFALFRLAGAMILRYDTDVVFSCVRPHHVAFYERLFFRAVSEPRQYHGVKFVTKLLACHREEYERVRKAAPLLDPDEASAPHFERMLGGATVPVFGNPAG